MTTHSINWCAADKQIEILDGRLGKSIEMSVLYFKLASFLNLNFVVLSYANTLFLIGHIVLLVWDHACGM